MAKTTTTATNINNAGEHLKNKSVYFVFKRLIDVVFSFLATVILLPAFLLISLMIFLTDKGSPFFIQKRVGKDKKLFNIFKFRTMRTDTDANTPTHTPFLQNV